MDLSRLGRRAKEMFDKRGGADGLKEDAAELRDIAKGEGSLGDKAKAAGQAIKDPGAPGRSGDAGEAGDAGESGARERGGEAAAGERPGRDAPGG